MPCAQPHPGADESEDAVHGAGDSFLSSLTPSFMSFRPPLKCHLARETRKKVLPPNLAQLFLSQNHFLGSRKHFPQMRNDEGEEGGGEMREKKEGKNEEERGGRAERATGARRAAPALSR